MVASISSPEDVVNLSLTQIGAKDYVSNMYDGSVVANAALAIYAQTRDAVLRESDWGFAEQNFVLTLQKTAPVGGYTPPTVWSSTYPKLPWIYQYGYPSGCLKVRSLRGTPIFIPVFDPSPVNFRIAIDETLSPPGKVILTNLSGAILVATGQVTDPTLWEPSFIEALAAALGKRMALALANIQAEKVEEKSEVLETSMASMTIG